MNGPKTAFLSGANSIDRLNLFLGISTGTPRDKLAIVLPALEALQTHFQTLQSPGVDLDQVNFKVAGDCCYRLTAIQEMIPFNDPADADNIRELSLQIIRIKEYITTFCFRAVNNELDSGLQLMRYRCQESSNALYVLAKEYASKKRTAVGFSSLVQNIKKLFNDFQESVLAFSGTARKIATVLSLDRLDIQYASPTVMKKFDALLADIIMEYKKINDSIRNFRDRVAPFAFQVEVRTMVAAPVALVDIVDKSNSQEAMLDHAKMLAGFSFDLDLILKDGTMHPLTFLSRCSAIFEHLEAADERMQKLVEIRDEKQTVFSTKIAANGMDDDTASAMKTYLWFSTRVQECEAVVRSEFFTQAKTMLHSAMNTEKYPHFNAEGIFVKPLTFNSDFWLVKTLTLDDFSDFQEFQYSIKKLKRKIDKVYTAVLGKTGKLSLQPFLSLQKQIKEWSRCSLL